MSITEVTPRFRDRPVQSKPAAALRKRGCEAGESGGGYQVRREEATENEMRSVVRAARGQGQQRRHEPAYGRGEEWTR
jgi:hypothetical protein